MYNHFFGFKERPFKLVPNPEYLFLSPAHEEALAHLKYAAMEGDGFVEIIGEVGTGKTMLCRAFLESLGPDIETAYIFNPKMDALRLLQAINDEFGIASGFDQTKALIDALNAFLMEKKKAGRKVILIVDEAQNLGKDVLEQLRLLSNLETTRDKLLQIILVGQPELGDLLDSYELRQLGQRISLACRLRPLTFDETDAYIRHRLHVASMKPAARFTRAAVRQIHNYSGGIPRLINIACDRALLVAYGMERLKIDGTIARTAVRELCSRGEIRKRTASGTKYWMLAAASVLLAASVFLLLQAGYLNGFREKPILSRIESVLPSNRAALADLPTEDGQTEETAAVEKTVDEEKDSVESSDTPATEPAAPAALEPELETAPAVAANLADYLAQTPSGNRFHSMNHLLHLWHPDAAIPAELEGLADDAAFLTLAARRNGLSILRIDGDLSLIRKLNLPAILSFAGPDGTATVHMAVTRADARTMTLSDGAGTDMTVPDRDIAARWTGTAWVFWKDFLNLQGIVGMNAPEDTVIALKMHLREIGFDNMILDGEFDPQTVTAVRQLQASRGIHVDGYVGPMTKIILYNEKASLDIPHLIDPQAESSDETNPLPPESQTVMRGVNPNEIPETF